MAYDALRAEYCRYAARQVWWACRAALCLDTISHTHSHLLPKAWCVLSLEFGLAICSARVNSCHCLWLLPLHTGNARGVESVEVTEQTPETVKDIERHGNGVVLPIFRYSFSRGTNAGFEHFDVFRHQQAAFRPSSLGSGILKCNFEFACANGFDKNEVYSCRTTAIAREQDHDRGRSRLEHGQRQACVSTGSGSCT